MAGVTSLSLAIDQETNWYFPFFMTVRLGSCLPLLQAFWPSPLEVAIFLAGWPSAVRLLSATGGHLD
jgi:hypothetical protein